MIPEEIWYFFVFPWLAFLGAVPAVVLLYMALGALATGSEYLPGFKSSKMNKLV